MPNHNMLTTMFQLTDDGKKEIEMYIGELRAKRKEILDAGKDTCDETDLPSVEDVELDLNFEGLDDKNEYLGSWGVTDHYNADMPLRLSLNKDFTIIEKTLARENVEQQVK